jgi:hypothetical protein
LQTPASAGATVGTVQASEQSGSPVILTYALAAESATFSIDSETGVITLLTDSGCRSDNVSLTVTATTIDSVATASLEVAIVFEQGNFNAPLFERDGYTVVRHSLYFRLYLGDWPH